MRRRAPEQARTVRSDWQARLSTRTVVYLMLGLAFVMFASVTAPITSAAQAISIGKHQSIIHWDASMLYAGQNNGLPWGPVGEDAIVHGANFPPSVQLRLVVTPGDSNSDPAVCQQLVVTTPVATVTTDMMGNFTQNFLWPAAADQVNQGYSICSLHMSNNNIVSSQDDGPFTVLASSPPAISISATSIAAGSSITVTGQNWVPPQQVSITISSCATCPGSVVVSNSATSIGQYSGMFSIVLSIPTTAQPGNYVIDAKTPTDLDVNNTTGVKSLTITAASVAPTPTTQPSPTPSPTVTATPQSTTSPTASATTTSGSGATTDTGATSGSNSGVLLALIIFAMMFFLIAAVILITLLLRRKRIAGAAIAPNRPFSPSVQTAQLWQNSPANYPTQFAHSDVSPILVGNYAPSPSLLPQQGDLIPAYGQQYQSNSSIPTEADDTQSISSMQYENAQYGQSPNLPTCSNCGRHLVPNLPTCGVCGMPLSAMR